MVERFWMAREVGSTSVGSYCTAALVLILIGQVNDSHLPRTDIQCRRSNVRSRPIAVGRQAPLTGRSRCFTAAHQARTTPGCPLSPSFGGPATAAASTGQWTGRELSDCCPPGPILQRKSSLGRPEPNLARWSATAVANLRTGATHSGSSAGPDEPPVGNAPLSCNRPWQVAAFPSQYGDAVWLGWRETVGSWQNKLTVPSACSGGAYRMLTAGSLMPHIDQLTTRDLQLPGSQAEDSVPPPSIGRSGRVVFGTQVGPSS